MGRVCPLVLSPPIQGVCLRLGRYLQVGLRSIPHPLAQSHSPLLDTRRDTPALCWVRYLTLLLVLVWYSDGPLQTVAVRRLTRASTTTLAGKRKRKGLYVSHVGFSAIDVWGPFSRIVVYLRV